MSKSVKAIVSFLGIACSGNFYTPIDVDMPKVRVEKILLTLQPKAIITDKEHFQKAKDIFGEDIKILLYEDLIATLKNESLLESISLKMIADNVLYVLFTSGSTGNPKGVVISHRSVIDYVDWVSETFKITNENIFGNQAPLYFDNSVLDIYVTLKTGATTYLIPKKTFAFPIKVLEFIKDKKINTIFWVPSVLISIANFEVLDEVNIDCLKMILFAGEVMPNKQLNIWRRRLPNTLFANLYGPTEITVDCTYYIVDRTFNDDEPLPIGYPCRNTNILVLNENDELVKSQEIGELCVRGTSLAYGYYNDFDKTEEVFVQNPLNKNYREKIYRTGDLVHYNEFGELMYDGRKDFQIKHMGYRIELGEIETAVYNFVDHCACLYIDNKIILCYVGSINQRDLHSELNKVLPSYMLPNKYYQFESLPLNANGKVDRIKLKENVK